MINTNVDYCKLGFIKAAFEDACDKLDIMLDHTTTQSMKDAFDSVMKGDLERRDELCDWIRESPDKLVDVKIETWYKICDANGLSESQADIYLEEIDKRGGFKWNTAQ